MATIREKINTIIFSQIHKLLDTIIDYDSPDAVRQYIRELEVGIGRVVKAANVADGDLRTIREDLEAFRKTAESLDGDINTLLSDGNPDNDHLALPLQVQYDKANERIASLKERETSQEKTLGQLNEAISKLQARQGEMMADLADIEAKFEAGKGLEAAAKAINSVAGLAVDSPNVDDLAARAKRKFNEQSAAYDRAMSNLGDATDDDVAVSQAEAALARRKAELANK